MIDWIDESCKAWGVQKRRILLGGHWYADDGFHTDGFAARSMAAKLWEEREGAGEGAGRQKAIEVMSGDALVVAIGATGISEKWHYLMVYKYVIPKRWMPTKSKILDLKDIFPKIYRDTRSYYDEIHSMHCWLMGRIPGVPREANAAHIVSTLCAQDACN